MIYIPGSSNFRLCAQQKQKPHLSPHYHGVGQEYWQSLSYLPIDARAGSDKIKAKLGGSRNADLTAPQGVTPQTLLIPNTTKLLHREGGWVTKLL